MWYYILFGILILFIIGYLGWAFEEPAGGVITIIIGVIFYISGSHIAGIITGIVGVCAYFSAKDSKEKTNKISTENFYFNELYKLLDRCFNSSTLEFNWHLWFDEDWPLYAGGNETLEKKLRMRAASELANKGKVQIRWINSELKNMVYADYRNLSVMHIKEKERSIVVNLVSMFELTDDRLRSEVEQYRQDIYDYILYGRKQLNSEKLSDMIKRGDTICN